MVDPVQRETMREQVAIIGRFIARQTGPVAARTNGVIREFRVDVGDRVQGGDVIAVLMKERLEWQHRLREAEVERYAAQVRTKSRQIELFQQELNRLNSLRNSPAFSQARLDDKLQEVSVGESSISEAKARLRMAQANYRLTAISLYDAEIKAPYSGIISKRHAEVGTYVDIGTAIATIINDQTMEIEAEVPAKHTKYLQSGMEIAAKLETSHGFNATVRAIIPDENPRTRTRAVRLTPTNNRDFPNVAINQSVSVFIPTGPKNDLVTVHKDAVLIKKGKRAVFVADGDRAQIRFIKLGKANGSRFSILQGLKPDELVVIRGNERLRSGTPITYDTQPDAIRFKNNDGPKK